MPACSFSYRTFWFHCRVCTNKRHLSVSWSAWRWPGRRWQFYREQIHQPEELRHWAAGDQTPGKQGEAFRQQHNGKNKRGSVPNLQNYQHWRLGHFQESDPLGKKKSESRKEPARCIPFRLCPHNLVSVCGYLHTSFLQAFYILYGKLAVEIHNTPRVVESGDSFFVPPGKVIVMRCNHLRNCMTLSVNGVFLVVRELFCWHAKIMGCHLFFCRQHVFNSELEKRWSKTALLPFERKSDEEPTWQESKMNNHAEPKVPENGSPATCGTLTSVKAWSPWFVFHCICSGVSPEVRWCVRNSIVLLHDSNALIGFSVIFQLIIFYCFK